MAPKGGRKSASGVRDEVSRLTAARDALDAEQAERRRREDAAFARYAEASARAATIATERDSELARLDAERVRAEDRATERLGEVEAEQAAVLAELNRDGRAAEDLATMFGLPVKRVRTVLRVAKNGQRSPATAPEPAATAAVPEEVGPSGADEHRTRDAATTTATSDGSVTGDGAMDIAAATANASA